MFRSGTSFLRALAAAAVLFAATVNPTFAYGGGHGGGGHGGGGWHGGGGGWHGGGGGYHDGGYYHGGYGGRYNHGGYGYYPGFGYGLGYGYYDGGYPSYYGYYPYDGTIMDYSTPYTPSYYPPVTNFAPVAPAASDATVVVHVPSDAQVWFDDTLTKSTGEWRKYETPPLSPNKSFSYTIRARWSDNGHVVNQSRRVDIQAGQRSAVDFVSSANTSVSR